MQLTIPNTFANGTGEANIIDAPKMNANFSAVSTVLNGNIEKDNIKTGSVIALTDTAITVSAVWTFSANPVFNAGGIPDSALTSNIPRLNAANSFSSKQTFQGGIDMASNQIEQIVIHKLATAPGSPTPGQIYYNTTDNKYYGWNGSAWNQMDYIGGYTGGAIRSYSDEGLVDDGDSYKFWFKTEGASPTVKIAIKGEAFPKRFYTELGQHTHSFSGVAHTHNLTDGGHTHTTSIGSHGHGTTQYGLSTHTHGVSGDTGSAAINHKHEINVSTGNQSASHNHGVGTLTAANESSHVHGGVTTGAGTTLQGSVHTHALSGSTANQSASHTHSISSEYTDYTNPSHTHTISLTSAAPSASQAIGSTDLGDKVSNSSVTSISVNNATATGTIGNTGVSGGTLSTVQKLYGKSLTVKIDTTTVTSDILTATSWSAIGDGTSSHAFHLSGTGELDASAWLSYGVGFHTLEIIEPESGYGCKFTVHIETT